MVGRKAGLMEKLRSPMPVKSTKDRNCPAISPQSVIGVPRRLQSLIARCKTRSTAGESG